MAAIFDSPNARLVLFRFRPRQAMPLHGIASSVVLTVLGGRGTFIGAGEQCELSAGQVVAYAPHEMHAVRAEDEELTVLATITPSPASR